MRSYISVMRKLWVSILLVVYAVASTGATQYVHYCMDKFINAGVGENNASHCDNCGMTKQQQKKSDCCKDNFNLVKIESDQLVTQGIEFNSSIHLALPPTSLFDAAPLSFVDRHGYAAFRDSPVIGKIPIFIACCRFQI